MKLTASTPTDGEFPFVATRLSTAEYRQFITVFTGDDSAAGDEALLGVIKSIDGVRVFNGRFSVAADSDDYDDENPDGEIPSDVQVACGVVMLDFFRAAMNGGVARPTPTVAQWNEALEEAKRQNEANEAANDAEDAIALDNALENPPPPTPEPTDSTTDSPES